MRRPLFVAGAVALLLAPAASAHGIGGIKDLPVPTWLFYYGAAIVLIASFAALGALWSRPVLDGAAEGRPLPGALQRFVLARATTLVLQALAVVLFVLTWVSAAFGTMLANSNFAPTFVYVVFWVGMPLLSVLLGNVWSVLNPWRAIADLVAWAWRRPWSTHPYPEWLGVLPAALLLLSFTVLELAYTDPSSPHALAYAIAVYSVATWAGMLRFGRAPWLRSGDGFSVYFRLLGHVAPFAVRERGGRREAVVRSPLSGLTEIEPQPGLLVFVSVMLGTVAFDGFSRTTWWASRLYSVQEPFLPDQLGLADLMSFLLNFGGLIAAVCIVALVFFTLLKLSRVLGHAGRTFEGRMIPSLVPIAFAYVVAHYFSLFVYQGQYALKLLSDPLGRGWDAIGTADFRPDLTLLSPNTIWYVQAGALVVGHVCGLMVAHDRALALVRSTRWALRSQYAILALMVLYTVGGLWILSRS